MTKEKRPWGWYEVIDEADRYKVKSIEVNPGEKLSLQKHHHRAEHWVVVSGKALVTKGDETFFHSENQSTYNPVGVVHSLENLEETELENVTVIWKGFLELPGGRPSNQRIEVTYAYTEDQRMECSFVDVESGVREDVELTIDLTEDIDSAQLEKFFV